MNRRDLLTAAAVLGMATVIGMPGIGRAESRDVIDTRVRAALDEMYRTVPGARDLAARARAALIMPYVVKGGFILGGSYGEGALLMNGPNGLSGPAEAYYSVASASVGLQAGVQKSSHALLFMNDEAVAKFRRSDGWEIGADAEVTFPDKGLIAQMNTTIMDKPVVGIVFGQDGLLLGASLEGAKYSPIVR